MHNIRKKPQAQGGQYQQQQQAMHAAPCKHPRVLTYELDEFDKEDFCERLCDLLQQSTSTVDTGKGEFSLNFLTPSIRGQRAKSLLTTRASKNIQSTESKNDDWEGDDRLLFTKGTIDGGDGPSSLKKARSNTRTRRAGGSSSRLPAPAVFHNCAACGSFYINESIIAVKPRQYCFRADVLPSQLICTFFKMQTERIKVAKRVDIGIGYGQELYLGGRKRIIDGVYKMGVKFQQARETIHIAIEMIDQYYLTMSQELSQKAFKIKMMHPVQVILHQVTVVLIASKFDEIDDNITAIRDLRDYVHRQVVQQQRKESSLLPSFDSIVECERKLLVFFGWDLKFVLPLHILRAFLANGVLFTNEFRDMQLAGNSQQLINKNKADWSRSITTEALSISDLIVSKGNVTYRNEASSDIAASIIYLARKNILEADSPTGKPLVPQIWPQELVMITRCTESKAKRILIEVLRPLDSASNAEANCSSRPQPHQPNLNLQIATNNMKQEAARPQIYRQSILSPPSLPNHSQLSAEKLPAGPQTTRAKQNPNLQYRSGGAPAPSYFKSEAQMSERSITKQPSQLTTVLQPPNRGVQSQRQLEPNCISIERPKSIGKSTCEEDKDTFVSSNFVDKQYSSALAKLPPRSDRTNTLKAGIKSSVEALQMEQHTHGSQGETHQAPQPSLLADKNNAPKAQSQRCLFPTQGGPTIHTIKKLNIDAVDQAHTTSLESLPTNAMTQQYPKENQFSSGGQIQLTGLSEESESAYGTNPLSQRLSNQQLPQIPISSVVTSNLQSSEKMFEHGAGVECEQPLAIQRENFTSNHLKPADVCDTNAPRQTSGKRTIQSGPFSGNNYVVLSSAKKAQMEPAVESQTALNAESEPDAGMPPLPSEPPKEATKAQQQPVHPKVQLQQTLQHQASQSHASSQPSLRPGLQQHPSSTASHPVPGSGQPSNPAARIPGQIKAKNAKLKSTYLEVKKAQIAKHANARQLLKDKKNSQKKLSINDRNDMADQSIPAGPAYPGTTKNQANSSAPSHNTRYQITKRPSTNPTNLEQSQRNSSLGPIASANATSSRGCGTVIQASSSIVSNSNQPKNADYYQQVPARGSVGSKLSEKCQSKQGKVVMSSSGDMIGLNAQSDDYEIRDSFDVAESSHQPGVGLSEYQSKLSGKKTTQGKPRVPSRKSVAGQSTKTGGNAGGSNSGSITGQKQASISGSFFKRGQTRESQVRSIGPHKNAQQSSCMLQISEPADCALGSEVMTTQEAEQQAAVSHSDSKLALKSQFQTLPSIENKLAINKELTSQPMRTSFTRLPTQGLNDVQQPVVSDFSTAVDRFAPVNQANKQTLSQKLQTQKYLQKSYIGSTLSRAGKSETQQSGIESISAGVSLASTKAGGQSASMRQMLAHHVSSSINTENHNALNQQPSSVLNKNKKQSIFSGASNQSATKTLYGGFGSASNATPVQQYNLQQQPSQQQRIFGSNQYKKSQHNFSQMQLMGTPTQALDMPSGHQNLRLKNQMSAEHTLQERLSHQKTTGSSNYNSQQPSSGYKNTTNSGNVLMQSQRLNHSGSSTKLRTGKASTGTMIPGSSSSASQLFPATAAAPASILSSANINDRKTSNTLQKMATEEAFVKMQQPAQIHQKIAPVPGMMQKHSSAGNPSSQQQRNSNPIQSTSYQQLPNGSKRNQKLNLGQSIIQQKQVMQPKMMLTLEQNAHTSSFLTQQKAAATQLIAARSHESIPVQPRANELHAAIAGNNNANLRHRHLKNVGHFYNHQQHDQKR